MSKARELAERVDDIVVDSSGNVGIGTTTPNQKLTLSGSSSQYANILSTNNGNTGVLFGDQDRVDSGYVIYANSAGYLGFGTGGSAGVSATERMRIDSSGNLLVGTTSTGVESSSSLTGSIRYSSGIIANGVSGNVCAVLNRQTSDGEILRFRKDGGTVGSIGNNGLYPYFVDTAGGLRITVAGGVNNIRPCTANGTNSDNLLDLGTASVRFDDVYATNGTIQTSDFNEKQDIDALNDAEQRVAQACKGLLRKFRWKDSVAEKGDDARIHFGIIAQDLKAAFEAEGLDAGKYAMFISSTWTDEETGLERTRMGVRYPELLAFIIATL